MDKKYEVWVGGVVVHDYLLTKDEADALAGEYEADGYTDVYVTEVED